IPEGTARETDKEMDKETGRDGTEGMTAESPDRRFRLRQFPSRNPAVPNPRTHIRKKITGMRKTKTECQRARRAEIRLRRRCRPDLSRRKNRRKSRLSRLRFRRN